MSPEPTLNTIAGRSRLPVFFVVFVLVFGAIAVVTFLSPRYYRSAAQIRLQQNNRNKGLEQWLLQTELEMIQSEAVLARAVAALDWSDVPEKNLDGGASLDSFERVLLLKRALILRTIPNTNLIEICASSNNSARAARIANAVAKAYSDYRLEYGQQAPPDFAVSSVEIISPAMPSSKPTRPNKTFNLFLGFIVASVAGVVITAVREKRQRMKMAAKPKVDLTRRIVGALWMIIGTIVASVTSILLFRIASFNNLTECTVLLQFDALWAFSLIAGFFLMNGKSWAKTCIILAAVIVIVWFALTDDFLTLSFLRFEFVSLGIGTICALLLPENMMSAHAETSKENPSAT